MSTEYSDEGLVEVVEWHMLDLRKFYPLFLSCSVTMRGLLYPMTVIKTRLQIQRQDEVYKGTVDAFRKIYKAEGMAGLYRGYLVNTAQVFSSLAYVTTYERVRHLLGERLGMEGQSARGLVAGGCAGAVGQTLIVPFDVVSQHMMVLGNPRLASSGNSLQIQPRVQSPSRLRRNFDLFRKVTVEILRRDGFFGLYRGFMASLICYVPNSGFFWSLYHFYSGTFLAYSASWVPQLLVHCVAAPCAGVSVSIITNSLDLLRARLQVQRAPLLETMARMRREEGFGVLYKGLSARCISSSLFSFFIILGYESLKRASVTTDYKNRIRW